MKINFNLTSKRMQNFNSQNIYDDLVNNNSIKLTDQGIRIHYDGVKAKGFMEIPNSFSVAKKNKIRNSLNAHSKLKDVRDAVSN